MIRDHLQSRLRNWLMRRTTSAAVRRVGELPLAIGTDIGTVRGENQDRVAVLRFQASQHRAFVVTVLCDGMGGMLEGATCASLAISGFLAACIRHHDLELEARLTRSAYEANDLVHATFGGRGGATLSAVIVDNLLGTAGVNIGDSRIYTYSNGVLRQTTVDDTIAGHFRKDGDQYPRSNELIQFIGVGEGLEPHVISMPEEQELIVLTSDGVHFVDKHVMQMVIQHAKEPAVAVRRLADIAKWCGGHDNASTAVISPKGMPLPPSDEIGIVQLWDPFGELQIVEWEHPMGKPQRQPPAPGAVTEPQTKKVPKPAKKPRQSKRKIEHQADEATGEPEATARPQLKIDFDDEADGGGHG